MRKFVLFGGGGFIGGNLATVADQNDCDVHIADRTLKSGLSFAHWNTVDITDREEVGKTIAQLQPQTVFNLAAMADIDQVEKEQDLAWRINVSGAKNIAASCARNGIHLIHFSSDAVFDGKSSSYSENDQPNPVNYYGRTKAEAEKAVFEVHPQTAVVRISLVLGFPVSGGNSLLASLEAKLEDSKEILAPQEEIRTPVDVITLSECILELADKSFSGLLHIGSTGPIDRYRLTQKIVSQMGFDEQIVLRHNMSEPDLNRAPRHRNGILDIRKAQQLLDTKLLSVDEGLQRAFTGRIQKAED